MNYIRLSIIAFNFLIIVDSKFCNVEVSNELQLPNRSDLSTFLVSLKRIVDYAETRANEADKNFMLGIFLVNVNLKASLRSAGRTLSQAEVSLLSAVLRGCSALLDDYRRSLRRHHRRTRRPDRDNLLMYLYGNDTTWAEALPSFLCSRVHCQVTPRLPPTHTSAAAAYSQLPWDIYSSRLGAYEEWVPSPRLSDECLIMLAKNKPSEMKSVTPCHMSGACYRAVYNGTQFGYALTHRLLIAASGMLGRHCCVDCTPPPMPSTDKLIEQLCSSAYTEAVYIAAHHYRARDIFMEQISLCSLLGHAEFLRRPWMQSITSWHIPSGCYGVPSLPPPGQTPRSPRPRRTSDGRPAGWRRTLDWVGDRLVGRTILESQNKEECDKHVTSVAAAALAAAVRFILQCRM